MKKAQSFLTAFTVSLCVFGLGAGLFVVGYNSRRMTLGQTAPGTSYRLENGRLLVRDQENRVWLTPVLREERLETAAAPAPVRATLYLLHRLTAAAENLAERVME